MWIFGVLAAIALAAYASLKTWEWLSVPTDAPVIGMSIDTTWHARAGLSTKNYEICLTLAGARIRVLQPGGADPERILDQIDGLLLAGGGDIDPALYGAAHTDAPTFDRRHDDFEIALIRGALRRDMPLLGVCRGVQILNVAHGGTLRNLRADPELSARHGVGLSSFDAHKVVVEPNSRLAEICGPGELPANSFHGQAVDRVGEGLRVAAVAEDGVIESLERPDKSFVLATQWHPEVPPPKTEYFARFIEEAQRYRQRRHANSP